MSGVATILIGSEKVSWLGRCVHSEVFGRFLEITHRDRDVVTFSEGFMQLCDVRRPVCYVRHATRDSGG